MISGLVDFYSVLFCDQCEFKRVKYMMKCAPDSFLVMAKFKWLCDLAPKICSVNFWKLYVYKPIQYCIWYEVLSWNKCLISLFE